MNVYLKENGGDQLPGDLILSWVVRSDLAPVPRTLEMTVKIKDGIEDRLKEGDSIWTGYHVLRYRIVKVKRHKTPGMIQGRDVYAAMTVYAVLYSCAEVSFRRSRAVVAENRTLGFIYRACGADIAIANDFTVRRFHCFIGQVPSFSIARALQEECACVLLKDGRLSITRLPDLFSQKPKSALIQSETSDGIDSEFMERHEIPAVFSLDNNGAFVFGDFTRTRATAYQPRTSERSLRNMTRVLVTRRVLEANLDQQIDAGDMIKVADVNYAVITAAHSMNQGQEGGAIESASKFWLGQLST